MFEDLKKRRNHHFLLFTPLTCTFFDAADTNLCMCERGCFYLSCFLFPFPEEKRPGISEDCWENMERRFAVIAFLLSDLIPFFMVFVVVVVRGSGSGQHD